MLLASCLILTTQQHLGGTTNINPLPTNNATSSSTPTSNNATGTRPFSTTPGGTGTTTTASTSASASAGANSTTTATFGQTMLHREGLWALAVLNNSYHPPTPATTEAGANASNTSPGANANASPGPGAYSSSAGSGPSPGPGAVSGWPESLCVDPVDCVNSILSLQASDMFPSAAWEGTGTGAGGVRDTITSLSSTGPGQGLASGQGLTPGSRPGSAPRLGLASGLGWGWDESVPLDDALQRMRTSGVALVDMLVLVCMMGRPNGTIEVG